LEDERIFKVQTRKRILMGIEEKQEGVMVPLDRAVQQELRRCLIGECRDCERKFDEVSKSYKHYCHYGPHAMEVPAGQLCTHKQYKNPSSYAVSAPVNEGSGEACRG